MNKHFAHLHLHTEFSLLDGAIKIPELLKFSKEQNWQALGISDHGNIFGAVTFFQQAAKYNIKPILGIEMYLTPDIKIKNVKEKYYHLVLIVKNKIGYKNLCKLIAYSYKHGFYFKPRIDYEFLKKHSEGLIASTACLGGHIPSLLLKENENDAIERTEWFLETFGQENFYFELMPEKVKEQLIVNEKLYDISKKMGVNCIATCDAHMLKKEDYYAHEILLAIQTKKKMTDTDRMSFKDFECYVKTTQECLDFFKGKEEIVWNTGKLADSCEFQFEFGKLMFPASPAPEGYTQETYFKKLCLDGLQNLKDQELIPVEKYSEYDNRLNLEMDLIIKMGFVGYFLVVSDFIRWAKQQNIPVGAGRGSAAGSLVAWAIEITNVDPIKYNLLFERFLNPERVSMPDIDIDFCIQRREEVINYVKDKYGHDCVCQIITFGTMMAKGVIKDVARSLGFPFQDSNALTDLIPNQLKIKLKEAIEQEPKLQEMINNNTEIKKLFDICFKLEGLTRHASKHAAGVVISPRPLDEVLPLYIPSKTDELVTQYAMTELECVGFLKMDFLGLKNLTVIEKALFYIKKNFSININLDKISLDDKKTFDLLRAGNSNGVFQFESEGIKEVMRKLQPERFEDLIALNALYRPGPLGSGMVDDFIERKHGRKKTTYMFNELEPILSETYGVIVYQEQVMKIASAIAGYTLGGADILRRAMGKKKVEVMAEQKELFVKGAKEKKFDAKKAAELFDLMAYFAGYGFNKSHSTAYALIAYHTAYLKANYPTEFMAALISFETSNPEQFSFYLQEINDMEIKISLADINKSQADFCAENNNILFGLQGIKNVGGAALENILKEREKKDFLDLLDFCKRVDLRTVNKRVVESLIYAGAMDNIPGNRAQKIAELEKIIKIAVTAKEEIKTGQMGLFSINSANNLESDTKIESYKFADIPDFTDKEKLEKEKEYAGFYLSSHPLKNYSVLNWIKAISFDKALEQIKNVKSLKEPLVTCFGLLQKHKVISTKKGDKMAFAQFEDLTSNSELIIFPSVYKKIDNIIEEYSVFIIKGFLDISSPDKCKIKVNELIPAEKIFDDIKNIKNFSFILPNNFDENFLEQIKTKLTAQDKKNKQNINLIFEENNSKLCLEYQDYIDFDLDNLKTIEKLGIKIEFSI
ncbi:DNA polymerase III subunit alpha [Candidatus Babeliales bacterium]|nr:DNA polymerase III subunit alpha [Candidatus Babeliales bacterium]MCF7899249.1 DNA polymerase III subunit alpha [Candidatus Babeliales bacterium]